MGSSELQPISAVEYSRLKPFRTGVSATWDVFAARIVDLQAGFRETITFADHVLNLRISGTCRLRQEADGRSNVGRSGPGSMHVVPAHLLAKWEASAVSQASHSIVVFIPESFLELVAEDYGLDSQRVEIVPQFLIHDPVMESVMTRLLIEARNGSPSGRLYAESACHFLAHHLLHAYSLRSKPLAHSAGGISVRRLRAVLDYIEESLGGPISLRRLADLAGVSPRHFERAFRQAVGLPPHAYVLEKRIAAARSLLFIKPTLTIETIAARVGFSSSSHLAAAFRRRVGYSPSDFRRLHSR